MFEAIPTLSRPVRNNRTVTNDLLHRLDSRVKPGLSEPEFRRLFAKCVCGLVMTRRVFWDHDCVENDVIDLTSDTSEDASEASGQVIIDLTDTDSEE
jgi:hypothetical protein